MAWALVSALTVIAGSVGTWVTAGPFSVGGTTHGDGTITLVLGVVSVALVLLQRARPLVALLAGAIVAIGVIDASSVLRAAEGGPFGVGLGWGLIVLPLGATSLLVWAVLEVLQTSTRMRAAVLAATIVAVVATVAVMAASGRFDLDEDADTRAADTDTPTPTVTADQAPTTTADTEAEAPLPQKEGRVGDGLLLTGSDGLTMRVTVTNVIDPLPLGEYDTVSNGKRAVGVELRLTNQSTDVVYDDSPSNGAAIVDADDEQIDSTSSIGDCTSANPRIAPGDSRKICIPFEVDQGRRAKTFQLALDSGFSEDGGEWTLPRRPSAASQPEPQEAADGDGSAPDDEPALTRCDQNISAGPGTTCGFADDAFRKYAEALQDGDDSSSVAVRATSPATGTTYDVECTAKSAVVRCRADDGAYVRFPQWAAEVY